MKMIFVRHRTRGFDNKPWRLLITAICLLTGNTIISSASALPMQLISARNPSVPLPAGGDSDSIAPVISPDGRYVVFSGGANDLVPGGNSRFALNVYLRARTANTTVLISANTNGTGGNDNSILGQVSANGRYVVFQSDASDLVPPCSSVSAVMALTRQMAIARVRSSARMDAMSLSSARRAIWFRVSACWAEALTGHFCVI
ncbi:MAG TPA: hypothetical protein VMA35_00970 [Candidatus Sulfopaludibacter sp.]|nr:hypothetical protein [Candidatus Sulfopaludibacter sp.]